MITASVKTEPNLSAGRPRILFEGLSRLSPGGESAPVEQRDYDAMPDGQRFLMVKRGEESDQRHPQLG